MHRFRLLGNATLIAMGLLALVAISPIGQVIAMLAAISVIGLPIAFLVVALPSVFLVLLASRLTGEAWACFRSGRTGAAIAFALALLLMADFFVFRAWRVNGWLDSRVAALVADDKDQAAATGSIGTLGVLRNTRNASDTDESCDDLCRRLLLTGAAKQVLALTAAPTPQRGPTARKTNRLPDWPALDPAPQMSGTAWRLEQRDECGVLKLPNSSRLVNVPEPARPRGTPYVPAASSEQLLRLKIAGGMCLVGEEMPLAQADALLAYGTLNSGFSASRAGYDAWADTISTWRIAFWRKDGSGFAETYRRTGVLSWRLPWLLVPTIIPGAELKTNGGWVRATDTRNRGRHESEPPIASFVIDKLRLSLRLEIEPGASSLDQQASLRTEQAKVVDRILAPGAASSDLEIKVVGDYLHSVGSALARRVNSAGTEHAERVTRILEQPRITLSWPAVGASKFAIETTPSLAPRLAAALVGRLEALPPPTDGKGTRSSWNEQIRTITSSLAQLPGDALTPYRPEVVALMRDRERRIHALHFLGHLDGFGPSIAPEILAMMDDAALLREVRPGELSHFQRTWAQVWRAGAQSICRMAPELTGSVEDFRVRVSALAAQRVRPSKDAVVAALVRMGVPEDDIRATLAIDPDDAAAMRRLSYALQRAGRKAPCH